jgi:hypothetical protein
MGIAGFLMYRRVKIATGWAEPAVQESKAIVARGKATALESKNRAMAFSHTFRTLAQHVGQKVETTTRLAREVIRPDLSPLQEAARAATSANGLVKRLSRLRQAGRIAAGERNGSRREMQDS